MQNGNGRLGRHRDTKQRLGAIWNGVIWRHLHHMGWEESVIRSLPIHSRLHFGTPPESTQSTLYQDSSFIKVFEGKGWRLERRGDEKFAASPSLSHYIFR